MRERPLDLSRMESNQRNFPTLELPGANLKIRQSEDSDEVFDVIRKKWIVLTPEEWVRQHFIHLLINHLGYPMGLFRIEGQHNYSGRIKRSDIVIMNKLGNVHLLVECKSHKERLSAKTLDQLAVYNRTLQAKYVSVTNGMKHFFWKFDGTTYKQLNKAPGFVGMNS